MAEEHDHKAELIADLARARHRLSENTSALRADLDFEARVQRSYQKSAVIYLGCAAVVGLALARLSPRRPVKKVALFKSSAERSVEKGGQAALLLAALKIGLDFARPAVTAWAQKQLGSYFSSRRARQGVR